MDFTSPRQSILHVNTRLLAEHDNEEKSPGDKKHRHHSLLSLPKAGYKPPHSSDWQADLSLEIRWGFQFGEPQQLLQSPPLNSSTAPAVGAIPLEKHLSSRLPSRGELSPSGAKLSHQ